MTRTEIIQGLINKINGKSYLEIGMGLGINFSQIKCNYKVCVDPNPIVPVTYRLTSDAFFEQNNEMFDIIFIDGLHWSEQVYRDILNSFKVLNEGGYIICHNINPHIEYMQHYPQTMLGEWTGDCWKAWVKLKTERNDLNMIVVDSDYGCGVISRGQQKLIKVNEELTWVLLETNRVKLLNLVSIDDFKKIL